MKKRRRRHRLKYGLGYTISRILLLILALLLIVGAVWGIVVLVKNSLASGGDYSRLPFEADDSFTFTKNSFLYYKNGILYYDDFSNNSKDASYRVNTSEFSLESSEAISVLYNTTAVQIVGTEQTIEGFGTIEKVKCGLDYIAVLFKDESGIPFLKIFDKSAAEVDEIRPESKNSFIMDFGFTDIESNTLWTLLADTSAEISVSTITTYDFSKKSTTGVMTVQHQLVESVIFTSNSIFAIGTNDLMRYNNGNLIYRLPVYGYELVDYSLSSGKCSFLFKSRTEGTAFKTFKLYTVAEKDSPSDSIVTLHLPGNTLSAALVNEKVVSCTPNKIYTHSYAGELLKESSLDFTLTESGVKRINDREVILFSSPSLYKYKVK